MIFSKCLKNSSTMASRNIRRSESFQSKPQKDKEDDTLHVTERFKRTKSLRDHTKYQHRRFLSEHTMSNSASASLAQVWNYAHLINSL